MTKANDLYINREGRLTWSFQYSGAELLDAANRLAEYHEIRVTFWKGQKIKALDAINDATVEIRPLQVTGGERHEVRLDPTLSARLGECEMKIADHQRFAREFSVWAAAFERVRGINLSLKPDDIQYFRLHDPGLEDEDDEE